MRIIQFFNRSDPRPRKASSLEVLQRPKQYDRANAIKPDQLAPASLIGRRRKSAIITGTRTCLGGVQDGDCGRYRRARSREIGSEKETQEKEKYCYAKA